MTQIFKSLIAVAGLAVLTGLAPAYASHEDKDSVTVTITVDGVDHEVTVHEDGVEVDGHPIEDIQVNVEIDGDIEEVIDEVLDEVEEALAEIEAAIEEARAEHDIED